ncbi:hypothetical protein ABWH91_16335 [Phycisphaerales bacterium ac7]
MRPIRTLKLSIALGASMLCATPMHARPPIERVAALQREHEDSLADLCRAFDAELLHALPPWSDDGLRWALFGVPTDGERDGLRKTASDLADLLGAMQPVIDNRLRDADAANEDGIEEAVQLSTVLLPLARARGLLVYGVAVEPAVGTSDESRRAFEEARRTAERAESVSAWSDAERELIIALASLRLRDTERAVEAIRSIRDAFREDRDLVETAPGTLASLRAAETLLVAIARSPIERAGRCPRIPETPNDCVFASRPSARHRRRPSTSARDCSQPKRIASPAKPSTSRGRMPGMTSLGCRPSSAARHSSRTRTPRPWARPQRQHC